MSYCQMTYVFLLLHVDLENSMHSSNTCAMTIVILTINKPMYYSFRCMTSTVVFVCVVCLLITLLPVSIDDSAKWHRLHAFISRR